MSLAALTIFFLKKRWYHTKRMSSTGGFLALGTLSLIESDSFIVCQRKIKIIQSWHTESPEALQSEQNDVR